MDHISLSTASAAVGLIVAVILVQKIRTWRQLRHIPGPPIAGFTRLWMLWYSMGGQMQIVLADASRKYGPLVRVGPTELVTSDPDALRKVLGVRTRYRRSDWFAAFRFDLGQDNVASQRDNQLHQQMRAKLAIGYSGKENDLLEKSIENNTDNLIHLLETKYLSTANLYKPVDFARVLHYFTLDLIWDIAFGKALGDVIDDEDHISFIATLRSTIPVFALVGVYPRVFQVLASPLFRWLLPSNKDPSGLGKVMGVAKEAVAERFGADKKDRRDMMGSFIRHGLTQKEAEVESTIQILAGSDTTATALRIIMLYVITNPRVYTTLLTELSTASLSNPVKDSEARKLPYLQAVIREGLRICPPAAGQAYREVPEGDDILCGYHVPAKTKVGYNLSGLVEDPKLWGEDAKVFRPERWLTGQPEEIRKMEANADLVFGYGKWSCLGKNIAQTTLNKVIVQLLRNFDISIVNAQQPWKSFNAMTYILSDMFVSVTKREPRF